MGIALKADETVAFGWEKIGTAVYPGRDYAGNVTVADIGFPEEAFKGQSRKRRIRSLWRMPARKAI